MLSAFTADELERIHISWYRNYYTDKSKIASSPAVEEENLEQVLLLLDEYKNHPGIDSLTAALLNHYIEQTLKATAVDLVLHYGEDFDLGDRLPVRVPELNLVASAQITSIKLTYEATGRKVVPVFDNIEFGGDVT